MENKNNSGTFAGIPYDWRKPTMTRFKSRIWNPAAPVFTPKWYGWGYDLNLYALVHPRRWRQARTKARKG